ncbi:cytidine deaminase [Clostridium isatidis]|uniref:Cytidine deaminase n=1 Tax=Clostridium isatidis TaxID=182773 RepID=A0A343JDQ2_9CLOT|nr:cytidine deaminase [Clostridium isatidis]ASW43660.1 cytidine deaminase [Clostridium isatidis]NLZ34016.1 cytidine deaminase [Clostridiales bacterium]
MDFKRLIEKALESREKAYVPYSKFKVGAAVLFEDDNIYTGCNIENASFGATNCAERTAIFKGISEGNRIIKAIAIVGDIRTYTTPCGICRQVISEFVEDENTPIILIKNKEDYIVKTFGEVMPGAFTKKDLEN